MTGFRVRIHILDGHYSVFDGREGVVLSEVAEGDVSEPMWLVQVNPPPRSAKSDIVTVLERALEILDSPTI